jgi:hypothetical protein
MRRWNRSRLPRIHARARLKSRFAQGHRRQYARQSGAVDHGEDAKQRFGIGDVKRRDGLSTLVHDADAPLAAHSVGRNLHSHHFIFLVRVLDLFAAD